MGYSMVLEKYLPKCTLVSVYRDVDLLTWDKANGFHYAYSVDLS